MRLTHDFSALWRIADELGAARAPFALKRVNSIPEIESQLVRGREVKLHELESVSGLLAFEGRQILLYIPDQGQHIVEVLAGNKDLGKKFHVAHCKTLDTMKNSGRFERYIATTDVSGDFQLTGTSDFTSEVKGVGRLYVCQNCLNMLNFKQCKVERSARRLRETFALAEFFETYSSCFKHLPARTRVEAGASTYAPNWKEISDNLRARSGWKCSDCRVDLTAYKHLLHVHHVDGNKNNNQDGNLQVLCKACHRLQPLHDHLYVPLEEMKLINSLRKAAGLYRGDWDTVLKYADPACHGVLGLAQAAGWPVPEVEHSLGSGEASFEVAWPSRKIALSLGRATSTAGGWRILDLEAAANMDFGR
jgi:5-methylcytosine-specific restriction endonuclease McrA